MPIKLIAILIPYKIIDDKFSIWMQVRKTNDEFYGLLEFPGGKVEDDESLLETILREVEEETEVVLSPEEVFFYKSYKDRLDDKIIELNIFLFNDENKKFISSGWHEFTSEKDLSTIVNLVPPANKIFLNEFLNSNKFKMLRSI